MEPSITRVTRRPINPDALLGPQLRSRGMMAPSKPVKPLKVLLIATGISAILVLGYLGITKWSQKKKEETATDETDVKQQEEQQQTPVVSQSDSFPLNVGMRGDRVKKMQNALISLHGASIPAGATGYFGAQTVSALKQAGYSAPVNEQAYKLIILGQKKVVIADSGFKAGQAVKSPFKTSVYSGQGTGIMGYVNPNTPMRYISNHGQYSKVEVNYYDSSNKIHLGGKLFISTSSLRPM